MSRLIGFELHVVRVSINIYYSDAGEFICLAMNKATRALILMLIQKKKNNLCDFSLFTCDPTAMHFKLNNNLEMPCIAFGTYNRNVNLVENLVSQAIDAGFCHFDTASLYRNEAQVGRAISGQQRKHIFITSKLPMNGFEDDKVSFFFERSLSKLQTHYLDLYLIHAPFAVKYKTEDDFYPVDENGQLESAQTDYMKTWRSMEKLYESGKVKAIGVSNFNIHQLQRILNSCKVRPMVNQIEVHVFFQNKKLVKFCQANQIQVSAFAPLASPKHCSDHFLANDETVRRIAKKHRKTWAQVCLRFLTQQAIQPVVGGDDESQMIENINCDTFDLDQIDLEQLVTLDRGKRINMFDYAAGVLEHKEYPFKKSDEDLNYVHKFN